MLSRIVVRSVVVVAMLSTGGIALASQQAFGAHPSWTGTAAIAPQPEVRAVASRSLPAVPEVALYGDSLSTLAGNDYRWITTDRVTTHWHAYPGTQLANWRDLILRDAANRLVLALGTNDSLHDSAAHWADLLDQLPASRCIVWPKPYEGSDLVRAFNVQMTDILASHPNVHVIDWDARVKAHPEWVLVDQTHYLPAGSLAYAEMLEQAAFTCQ